MIKIDKFTLKSLLSFFIVVIYIMNVIGSTGNLLYFGEPLFAVVSLLVAWMAFPRFKSAVRFLMGREV